MNGSDAGRVKFGGDLRVEPAYASWDIVVWYLYQQLFHLNLLKINKK